MGGSNSRAFISKTPSKEFERIRDNYKTLEEVTARLRNKGLESSNLIVGIDFTKSNEWKGKHSFGNNSLHAIRTTELNPYEKAISIIGKTLSSFDEDNLIPCFGFGDVTTHDRDVFSFYADNRPCHGFENALSRYREIVPWVTLAGPTSFAPIIRAAINIVKEKKGQYHILLIIADGEVTKTESSVQSSQEKETVSAIIDASDYALSIILVGVGDGPWDTMKKFDDNVPRRSFDNFQFVDFTAIMSRSISDTEKEALFALNALMEIPEQYEAIKQSYRIENHVNSNPITGQSPSQTRPPPTAPPTDVLDEEANLASLSRNPSISRSKRMTGTSAGPEKQSVCPECRHKCSKDTTFQCGHQTCNQCAYKVSVCPICRQAITNRIKLYG